MRRALLILLSVVVLQAMAQDYVTERDVRYTEKKDAYSKQRLTLDIYHPEGLTDCPVVVWFHGGGLEGGSKEIPEALRWEKWVVIGVNYRLLPNVTVDQCIDDAAEAVAWVMRHVREYGGSEQKITVSGHSAGGYLALMLCLDKEWLKRYGADADSVMLYVPLSGQAITHYNARKMQGIAPLRPTIDKMAPLYWVRPDCPPLVLVCGDRELELYGRYDENQYLARMMKLVGHKHTYLYEVDGHDHVEMMQPGFHILKKHVKQALEAKEKGGK